MENLTRYDFWWDIINEEIVERESSVGEFVKFSDHKEAVERSDNSAMFQLPNTKEFIRMFRDKYNDGNEVDMYTISIIMNSLDLVRQLKQ